MIAYLLGLKEGVLATFELYNEAGAGFNMPASAADGYVVSAASGATTYVLYDNGSLAVFGVLGDPTFNEVAVSYAAYGDTLYIYDVVYSKNGWTVLEALDLNLVGSISNLSGSSIFYLELNLGDDYFGGNDYVDIIHGGPGNDTIDGYGAGDILFGDNGNDALFGDDGNDVLLGGAGNDLLDGLAHNDELWGGPGYDTFCFGKGYGRDVIKDFNRKQDDLFIDKGLVKNFKKLKKVAEKYKGGIILDFKGSDDLIIEGIQKKQLKKIDVDFFHF